MMTSGGAEHRLDSLALEREAELSSSSRSRSMASPSDVSFRSSVGSSSADLEFDDDGDDTDDEDAMYPRPVSEYEEIPSFRWIATPLRWWKKTRSGRRLSKKSAAAATASTSERTRPTDGEELEDSKDETRTRLTHFDAHSTFTADDLLRASAEVLGKGVHGTSYKARLEDGKLVVVKRLKWKMTSEFEAEVKLLGKLRHPNILVPIAYYFDRSENLLVFDYMPMRSLSSILHGEPHATGSHTPLDWPTRMNVAIGATRGLHYLHTQANMVHGNLASRNVLLLDNHADAKIADCSLSCLIDPDGTEGFAVNIPEVYRIASCYRAPELYKIKNRKADASTDVYSLGVILLELLTGKPPMKVALDMPKLVVKGQSADEVFDPNLTSHVAAVTRSELLNTLTLALGCVDPSPHRRPKVQQVLQELEEIKSRTAGARDATKAMGENIPTSQGVVAAGGIIAILRSSSTVEEPAEPISGAPSLEDEDSFTSLEDEDFFTKLCTAEPISGAPSLEDEESFTKLCTAQPEGINNGASFSDLNMNEKAMAEDRTGESKSTEGTDATTFGGAVVNPVPSSIDWATLAIEGHLEVPTSPPLINSHPDVTYQRYFQTLYDLAHRSPPLPSSLLEAQLNKMIIGLHSLGYPLDAWVKAATLALVFCKKREYIDHHVDGHKAQVEARLEELTSAMAPIKEEISRSQSHIIDVERKQEELDEIIAGLEDQLALLKTQQEEFADSLATARDQLGVAEAKVEPLSIDMARLEQQHAAISDLRSALLGEIPSLDEVFDSSFHEIMTKKF